VTTRSEVLLVDDDLAVLHALNKLLGSHVSVRSATSGLAAIELLEASPVDLVMLDLDMPGLTGFDVLSRLKASRQLATLPVIVLSGSDEADVEARVLESGAADFIAKPFVPVHVLARVRTLLQMQRIKARARWLDNTSRSDPHAYSILIVDDDVQSIHALRAMLSPLGAEIRFAGGKFDAMRAIESDLPDLVVLDMQLADGTGFELCSQLRADPLLARLPVLIVTRFDDEANEAHAYELGAMDFVSKRCAPAVLQARIRKLLRHKWETDALFLALDRHWRQVGQSRLAMVIEASSDGILSVDERGKIVLINQAACALLGVSRESALQSLVEDVLAGGGEGPQALLTQLLDTVGATPSGASLITLPGADGQMRLVEPRYFQMTDEGSTMRAVALRDVTEREAASVKLRELGKAQAGREARAMMLSCVVHEVGNLVDMANKVKESRDRATVLRVVNG
jgi:PAS domain S-box-containing protein